MNIKADRGVLYFEVLPYKSMINLQKRKEASHHIRCHQNRGYPCPLFFTGSITVEASFCATAFFLVLFSLLYLFLMLTQTNQTQMRLASAVQQYECFGTKTGTIESLLKRSLLIRWDEEKGICFTKEIINVPFLGGAFFQIPLYQQMKINNYQGRSMVSEGRDTEEYVYIAEHGQVYHRDRACVYLNPDIRSIKYKRVTKERNNSGAKYKLCKSCSRKVHFADDTIIYITPYGDNYHATKDCSGLKRTIRKVKLSETGAMAACNKCE